ncbi:MAG TPA: nuclear transport factor 2 family protein [Acidimicrobiales bacterium]|nr:nuclear transport factor 2 family protein [Acidimicrobiales bacterium]
MTPDQVDGWLAAYARAWREKDDIGIVQLFTEDALYRSSPTAPAHRGRDGIAAYWRRATQTQSDLDLRFGQPIQDGHRVAVEWWAVMKDPDWRPEAGSPWVTLPGCLLLRFSDLLLCQELREYYNPLFGEAAPAPEGWGE